MSRIEGHLIDAFLEMMSAERGAAANTIAAYRRDLVDYASTLARRGVALTKASRQEVVGFLESLKAEGLSASSSARKLSAIRQFHKFLCADGIRPDDPTRIVASPNTPPYLFSQTNFNQVSCADVDGDGYADALLGSRTAQLYDQSASASYDGGGVAVVFGGPGPWPAAFDVAANLDGAKAAWIAGDQAGEGAGMSLDTGDVNRDGIGDVAIGSPWYTAHGSTAYAGRASVVFGRARPWPAITPLSALMLNPAGRPVAL